MSTITKTTEATMSRRAFVGLAGATVTAGILALAGCGSDAETASTTTDDADKGAATESESETTSDASATSASGDEGVVRFGCEAAYAPYEWKQDKETEYTLPIENMEGSYADGFDIQLMKLVAEELGKTPVLVNMSFDGLISALNNGQVDILCSGMSATPERKESVDFSEPYTTSAVGVMVARDSQWASATSLDDLSGISIVAQKASVLDDVIDQIPNVNHMSPVNTIPECVSRLTQGTVDACTVDANDKDMYEATYPDYVVLLFEDGKGFETEGVDPAMAVVKGDPQGYLPAINKVIDNMTSEERQKLWDGAVERSPE